MPHLHTYTAWFAFGIGALTRWLIAGDNITNHSVAPSFTTVAFGGTWLLGCWPGIRIAQLVLLNPEQPGQCLSMFVCMFPL